jgi:tetratricopeptide (TPR) repeat protein/energy-coupling factor transporter ATP-binding protein EcfA2
MGAERIFVGRKAELEQFKKVLEDPYGQAILVVGQAGMGKTWLINKMADLAENHPQLQCGCVRYEVTPTDSVDSTMALMMDNAFEAAQVEESSFVGTKRRLEQWRRLLNVINIGDLVMSLRRDPQRNTRDQFLERLRLISEKMLENGRAIFVIDPEKYMQKESDQAWAIVVKQLPEKIKLVFAQRPEDVLVDSAQVRGLINLKHIPDADLEVLDEEAIDDLLAQRLAKVPYSVAELRKAVARYHRHPYAVVAALDLIEDGVGIEQLATDPTPEGIAKDQRDRAFQKGPDAVQLLEAHAVLEVGAPDDVVDAVSGIGSATYKSLLADNYLGKLLREEGYGKRIYHAILADYIGEQIGEAEKKAYHSRAVEVYREKLNQAREKQTKPDALAAMRLPEHVLAAEGPKAFVEAFARQCFEPLLNAGLLDGAVALSQRALGMVEQGSVWEGYVWSNLGLLYRNRGDLDEAEDAHKRSLGIVTRLGCMDAVASVYAGLGLLYEAKGNLRGAEKMHLEALRIEQKIGRVKGVARQYHNLGKLYGQTGELDKAEELFKKALHIHVSLGNQHGIGAAYSNLGLVYHRRGDLDKAEATQHKSLAIADRLGLKQVMATNYANLGLIHTDKGELDKAEEMHKRSLEIAEKLGMQEVTANQYGNLGVIYEQRGDIAKARQYWEKALQLYKKIGMPHMVEKVQGWIDQLGETPKSEDRSQKSEDKSER